MLVRDDYAAIIRRVHALIDISVVIIDPHLPIELLLRLIIRLQLVPLFPPYLRQYPTEHAILVNLVHLDVIPTEWALLLTYDDFLDT